MKRSLLLKYWSSLLPHFYGLGIEMVEMNQYEGWQLHTSVCLFTIQKYRWQCWLWMCYKLNIEQVHTCSCQMVIRQNLLFVPFPCFANVKTQFIKSSFFRYKNDDDCFEGTAPQILSEEIIIKRFKYFISIIAISKQPIVNL